MQIDDSISSRIVNMKKIVKKLFEITGYKIEKVSSLPQPQKEKPVTEKHFFDLFFSLIDPADFFLVQIGANDGKSRDTLFEYISKYNLAGILVEPQPEVFKRLTQAHKENKRIRFLKAAIFNETGEKEFYSVKKSLINHENYFETTAIASFDRKTFLKTLQKRIGNIIEKKSDDLNEYFQTEMIPTLSFSDFLQQEKVNRIDLLYLDCEGVDYEIIKMINFNLYKPKIINFESKFLNDTDRFDCESLLESQGYKLFRYGNDTCAFLT